MSPTELSRRPRVPYRLAPAALAICLASGAQAGPITGLLNALGIGPEPLPEGGALGALVEPNVPFEAPPILSHVRRLVAPVTGPLFDLLASLTLGPATPALSADSFAETRVIAAQGVDQFTLRDDRNRPVVRVTVPPHALSEDVRLRIEATSENGGLRETQRQASPAYRIHFVRDIPLNPPGPGGVPSLDTSPITLAEPMLVEIRVDRDKRPVHPELGEIATLEGGDWARMPANFYKGSSRSVLTMTTDTDGTFMVAHRRLQTRPQDDPEVLAGRDQYLNDTMGSERYFGDVFGLHEVLNNIDPLTAIALGAQIDITKLPEGMIKIITEGDLLGWLTDPSITRKVLKADAVVGVRGFYDDPSRPDHMTSVGLTCGLCHVTVTQTPARLIESLPGGKKALMPLLDRLVGLAVDPLLPEDVDVLRLPIGTPIFGPPNAKFDPGAFLGRTPLVAGDPIGQKQGEYFSWGPGGLDPRFLPGSPIDDGVNNPSQIFPHWNYIDLAEQGYAATWPGYIQLDPDTDSLRAALECGLDFPLGLNGAWGTDNALFQDYEFANQPPQWVLDNAQIAEANEPGFSLPPEVFREKINNFIAFMESIPSPPPREFDESQAEIGWRLFHGRANCASCHETAEFTGRKGEFFTHIVANPPQGLLGFGIKVPQLRGLGYTAPYFHDGSAATLRDVVERYASPDIPEVPNDLSEADMTALVEFLKSI